MKNKFVGLREFQQKLHANLPQGDEIIKITRHGKPAYTIVSDTNAVFASTALTPKGMNAKLGLPVGDMQKVTIAFDVDGTLVNNEVKEIKANEEIRSLLISLSKFKNTEIIVWSGSGELWARQVVNQLGLGPYVDSCASKMDHENIKPDIAVDDIQDTAIGKINLIVKQK